MNTYKVESAHLRGSLGGGRGGHFDGCAKNVNKNVKRGEMDKVEKVN